MKDMMNTVQIATLKEIASDLGLTNMVSELDAIYARSQQENASLMLPLVGEFSSGKTTLINALTDCKKLETATKPTTATIYEVHFGCESSHATVLDSEGKLIEVDDIADLKNDNLADAKVVTVFDTSSRVPSTTIIVDTPGLSSPDPRHKQTLIDFLPKADGIILVSDINQQITRSLTEFIETIKLSNRPIFLVLTKSDTKSESDIELAKQYISDNCKIPVKQMAVVSSATGKLDELYELLDRIQKDKGDILAKVDGQRVKNITGLLSEHIDTLMQASSSDDQMDAAIRQTQYELDKIKRNIDRLINSMSDDIEDLTKNVSRKFEDIVMAKLNALVSGGRSADYDAEAVSHINSTSSILLNELKAGVRTILRDCAQSCRGGEDEVPLASLEVLDLNSISMEGMSYNLDLNSMGHEYDGWIKTGVIAAAAVGAVATVGASAVGVAGFVDNLIDVADTASDIGSIISNKSSVEKISGYANSAALSRPSLPQPYEDLDEDDDNNDDGNAMANPQRLRTDRVVGYVSKAADTYSSFNQTNEKIGQKVGVQKGILDSMVGLVTDKAMAKPQRVRAVRNFIDTSLVPEFRNAMGDVKVKLLQSIRDELNSEASEMIANKTEQINRLRAEKAESKERFASRMATLSEYKNRLLN